MFYAKEKKGCHLSTVFIHPGFIIHRCTSEASTRKRAYSCLRMYVDNKYFMDINMTSISHVILSTCTGETTPTSFLRNYCLIVFKYPPFLKMMLNSQAFPDKPIQYWDTFNIYLTILTKCCNCNLSTKILVTCIGAHEKHTAVCSQLPPV